MAAASSASVRRARAVESFRTAAECIGPVVPGLALFAITRGQFSLIDAVLHVLSELGPSRVSIWTWVVADYEINVMRDLMARGDVTSGRLVIDQAARSRNADLVASWVQTFGAGSVRYVRNHAKIATVEGGGRRVLLRGSMNLNFNPRFEQLDVTEGGADFDLVRAVEDEIPALPDDCSVADMHRASRLTDAFEPERLAAFGGVKVWRK